MEHMSRKEKAKARQAEHKEKKRLERLGVKEVEVDTGTKRSEPTTLKLEGGHEVTVSGTVDEGPQVLGAEAVGLASDPQRIAGLYKATTSLPKFATSSARDPATLPEIPYLLPCPEDVKALVELVDMYCPFHQQGISVQERMTDMLNRIRTAHSLHLKAENRRKLALYYGALLDFVNFCWHHPPH